jgi:hypothetical protein
MNLCFIGPGATNYGTFFIGLREISSCIWSREAMPFGELLTVLFTMDGVAQEVDEADDGADADGSVPDAVVVEGAEHGLLLVDAVGEHHAVPFRGRVGCGLGGADEAQLQHLQHRPDRQRPGPLRHEFFTTVYYRTYKEGFSICTVDFFKIVFLKMINYYNKFFNYLN